MSKPSWDEAPDWANWLAMDSDGSWWWFADEPIKHVDIDWRSEEKFERASLTKWDNSKERHHTHPNGKWKGVRKYFQKRSEIC